MFIDTIEMWLYNTDITNTPTIFSVHHHFRLLYCVRADVLAEPSS